MCQKSIDVAKPGDKSLSCWQISPEPLCTLYSCALLKCTVVEGFDGFVGFQRMFSIVSTKLATFLFLWIHYSPVSTMQEIKSGENSLKSRFSPSTTAFFFFKEKGFVSIWQPFILLLKWNTFMKNCLEPIQF